MKQATNRSNSLRALAARAAVIVAAAAFSIGCGQSGEVEIIEVFTTTDILHCGENGATTIEFVETGQRRNICGIYGEVGERFVYGSRMAKTIAEATGQPSDTN